MSRSGYNEDYDDYGMLAMYRGQVANASRGKRGQQFFLDLIAGLDALPEKKLIVDRLQDESGCVCALGAVGLKRGVELGPLEPAAQDGDGSRLGLAFNIARQLALETEYVNDEEGPYHEMPQQRWVRVRKWAVANLLPAVTEEGAVS